MNSLSSLSKWMADDVLGEVKRLKFVNSYKLQETDVINNCQNVERIQKIDRRNQYSCKLTL